VSELEATWSAARSGSRAALARLLSWVERGGAGAEAVAALAFPASGRAPTVGVTGAPGAGKSTLVSALLAHWRSTGETVAVLAVDPSSPFSGGAILGDRVRMQDHALDEGVFVRSLASRGELGGLSLAVPEALRVLDAVGFDRLVVETVGVGQVELEVAGTTDTVVVVVTPGWGDAIQANKAGLLEVADVFAVNKADRPGAAETRRDLEAMLDLSGTGSTPTDTHGGADTWRPPVLATVATAGEGIPELAGAIDAHRASLVDSGALERRRAGQLEAEVRRRVVAAVERRLRALGVEDPSLWGRLARRELEVHQLVGLLLDQVAGDGPTARR
jgi:LAO/AO transport system kinase